MVDTSQRGRHRQRSRTRAALVEGALEVLRTGRIPSVSDAAQASGVSRATAYRYFSDASTLLSAVLQDTVTPIGWEAIQAGAPDDPLVRISLFLDEALPIIRNGDAQLRAALRVALEQRSAGGADADMPLGGTPVQRGTRLRYVEQVLAPMRDNLNSAQWQRIVAGISVIVGIEAPIVLHDICGLSDRDADDTIRWAARALINAARNEDAPSRA